MRVKRKTKLNNDKYIYMKKWTMNKQKLYRKNGAFATMCKVRTNENRM